MNQGPPPATRWSRIKTLFHEALERPAADRPAYLEEACGGDDELRREVESLLRSHETEDRFVEPPDAAARIEATRSLLPSAEAIVPGARVGAYRVLEKLATGGMGVVFLAERDADDFHKRVAIKVLKRGLDTEALLHRFAHERQALAALEHPRIARLLDGGALADGRPYLVMEYIDGIPITRFADERRLTIRERIRLFRRALDAVRHAHRHLVIHRDLKPDNILVTAQGEPKLVDFGVAKLLDAPPGFAPTAAELRPMTIEYASPEQIRGEEMSTATDVFSLGVILFELLTGKKPHAAPPRTRRGGSTAHDNGHAPGPASRAALRRATLEQPAALASTAVVRVDVGENVGEAPLEGLASKRRRRPVQLARRLRGDLDCILAMSLEKDPAYRYASIEAFDRDLERHLEGRPVSSRAATLPYRTIKFVRRHAVPIAVASAFVGLLSVAFVAVLAQQSAIERQRDDAVRARAEADHVIEFLESTLASADPGRQGPDVPVRALLDEAAVRLTADLESIPAVRARLHMTLGRSYRALGQLDEALAHHRSSLELARELHGVDALETADAYTEIGTVEYMRSRFPQARDAIETALAIRLQHHTEDPDSGLARVYSDLGAVLRSIGHASEARTAFESALAHVEPQSLIAADILNNQGNLERLEGNGAIALRLLERSTAIRRELLPPDHPRLIQSLSNLGALLAQAGNAQAAESALREALASARRKLGNDHRDVAIILGTLGILLENSGDHASAEAVRAEAASIFDRALPEGSWRAAVTHCLRACSLSELGRYEEAQLLLDAHIESVANVLGAQHERVIRFRNVRARAEKFKPPVSQFSLTPR